MPVLLKDDAGNVLLNALLVSNCPIARQRRWMTSARSAIPNSAELLTYLISLLPDPVAPSSKVSAANPAGRTPASGFHVTMRLQSEDFRSWLPIGTIGALSPLDYICALSVGLLSRWQAIPKVTPILCRRRVNQIFVSIINLDRIPQPNPLSAS